MQKVYAGLAIAGAALALMGAGPAPVAESMGDYDGDGRIDKAALFVAPGVGYEVAIALAKAPNSPITVDRGPPQLAGYTLQNTPPGQYVGSAAAPPRVVPERLNTQYEGLSFGSGNIRRMIYWTGSNFRAVWLAP